MHHFCRLEQSVDVTIQHCMFDPVSPPPHTWCGGQRLHKHRTNLDTHTHTHPQATVPSSVLSFLVLFCLFVCCVIPLSFTGPSFKLLLLLFASHFFFTSFLFTQFTSLSFEVTLLETYLFSTSLYLSLHHFPHNLSVSQSFATGHQQVENIFPTDKLSISQ